MLLNKVNFIRKTKSLNSKIILLFRWFNHLVVGWINGTVFRGEERAAPYTLQVGYIKGGSVISRGRMKLRLKQITHSAGTNEQKLSSF